MKRWGCGCPKTASNTAPCWGRTTGRCRRCWRAAKAKYDQTRRRHARVQRKRGMLNEHGLPITADDLAAARAEVGDRCFLCRRPARPDDPLVPDHSQQSGLFRAWVHQSENVAEGYLRRASVVSDDPADFDKLQCWIVRLMALVLAGVRPNTARAVNRSRQRATGSRRAMRRAV